MTRSAGKAIRRGPSAAVGAALLAAAVVCAFATDAPPGRHPATARRPSGPVLLFAPRRAPTAQQTKVVLAFAREHLPEQYERLRRLLDEDSARAGPMIHRLYRLYVSVRRFPPEVRKAAVGRYQANAAIYWTLRALRRSTDPAERKTLTDRLRKLITQQFDHEQTVQEHQLERFAQRAAELKAEIERLRSDREKVIARRIERLLAPPPTSRPARDPHAPPRRRPLTPEQAAEVMAFASKHMPELHQRLEKLRKDDLQRARPLMRRLRRLVVRIKPYPPKVREAAIARHKVNVTIFETVRRIRQAEDPAETRQLTQRLRELVGRQFDYDQPVKEFEISLLKQQLAEARLEVERRRRDRERIIAERLKRLLSAPKASSRPAATAEARTPH